MLSPHAIARTLIPAVGVGLTGLFTANQVTASVAFIALSGGVNELLSHAENDSALVKGLQRAVDKLAGSLDGERFERANYREAIRVCSESLARAEMSVLRDLLVTNPDRAGVAALVAGCSLTDDERALAERLLALALEAWHSEIADSDPLIGALRELLSSQMQRLEQLEQAGLRFPDFIPYDKSEHPPSQLFRPESGVLQLMGRESELSALKQWAETDVRFSLRALAAPGGMGKTRLAMQFLIERRTEGWLAAFVDKADKLALSPALSTNKIALVLDYADYRKAELDALLQVAKALVKSGKQVRVLLLARPDERWWKEADRAVRKIFNADYKISKPKLVPLVSPALTAGVDEAAVLKQVATKTGLEIPVAPFRLPSAGTPLIWMMAAYRHLHGQRPSEDAAELCEDIVLDHERAWLEGKLGDGAYLDGAMQALALFTFAGGVKEPQACEALIRSVPLLADCDASRTAKVLHSLKTTYPNTAGIDALRPDLLGEYLCGEQLDEKLLQAFVRWAMGMIEAEGNHREVHLDWRFHLAHAEQVCRRTRQWAESSQPARFSDRWNNALTTLSIKELGVLDRAVDYTSVKNQEFNDRLSEILVNVAGKCNHKRAHALTSRSASLAGQGRHLDAFDTSKEAMELYENLNEQLAGGCEPERAMSMYNFAKYASDIGEFCIALRAATNAVTIYRQLNQRSSGQYADKLGICLNLLAIALKESGDKNGALLASKAAAEIYELLFDKDSSYRFELATNLSTFSLLLGESDDLVQALEVSESAERHYRELPNISESNYLAKLSQHLCNFANLHMKRGCGDLAKLKVVEATSVLRDLVEKHGTLYVFDLAKALVTYANVLRYEGQREHALEVARESVDLFPEKNGNFQFGDISRYQAIADGVLCVLLRENGYYEHACVAGLEAAAMFAELWQQYPKAYEPYAMRSIQDTVESFEAAGQDQQAAIAALLERPAVAEFLQAMNER